MSRIGGCNGTHAARARVIAEFESLVLLRIEPLKVGFHRFGLQIRISSLVHAGPVHLTLAGPGVITVGSGTDTQNEKSDPGESSGHANAASNGAGCMAISCLALPEAHFRMRIVATRDARFVTGKYGSGIVRCWRLPSRCQD